MVYSIGIYSTKQASSIRGFITICFYLMLVWLLSHYHDDPANGNILFSHKPVKVYHGNPTLCVSLSVCKGFPLLCEHAAFIFPREAMLYRSYTALLYSVAVFISDAGTVVHRADVQRQTQRKVTFHSLPWYLTFTIE